MLAVGLPRPTIALLDAIVERELDLASLGDFYSPDEIVTETIDWRERGLPAELVVFAGDESGNKFCFPADRSAGEGVWFFDHDFGTIREIALSFGAWIEELCAVEPWPED